MSYQLPEVDAPHSPPTELRVRYVSSRAEARRFIAFKHITGPLKWDAYAEAKYANDWLKEDEDIEVVSKMLGGQSQHSTAARGRLSRSEASGNSGLQSNDRTKKRFAFSHLNDSKAAFQHGILIRCSPRGVLQHHRPKRASLREPATDEPRSHAGCREPFPLQCI
ncbi:MAG: hypothetical protein WCC90_14390 [Methylocella sp.]